MRFPQSTRSMLLAVSAFLAVGIADLAFAAPDGPAPLPTAVVAPPAGKGVVYSFSRELPEGYAEQEFLVSGKANIYTHDAERNLLLEKSGQAYTTRIVVRYPKDRKAFSGNLIFDLSHPEGGTETLWGFSKGYIARSGDTWVTVTTRREPHNPLFAVKRTPIEVLKGFDPVRYGPIDFTDGGLTWDIISQVGRLMKSNVAANPLRGYLPKRTILGGFSGAGALTLFYINEGFPNAVRMPNGRPIFDAYLVGEPSQYPRVNSHIDPAKDDLSSGDPRFAVRPRDVPAIQLYTNALMEFTRSNEGIRQDSDAPDDRFRIYMVAGAAHAGDLANEGAGLIRPGACPHPSSDVSMKPIFALVLDYLKQWSAGTKVPPHARPLELTADRKAVVDAMGNPKGGVRTTKLDVPASRYITAWESMQCGVVGQRVPLTQDELKALYGTPANYIAKVQQRADLLVQEQWLLPADVEAIVADARKLQF